MKKVLVIEGGPRPHQNSDTLSDSFIQGAEEAGNEVKKIYLNQKKIHGCIGCRTCKTRGFCVFKDDAVEILDEMMKADAIVMVSPVYFYSITAQLKTLIDRSFAIENVMENKDFYFIMTCAAPYEEPWKDDLDIAVRTYQGFVKCHKNCHDKGVVIGDAFDRNDKENHHAWNEAYRLGKEIH